MKTRTNELVHAEGCSGPATPRFPPHRVPHRDGCKRHWATSSAAMGWMSTGARRTVFPRWVASAMRPVNSKNCVERRIEYGIAGFLDQLLLVDFARRYPLSGGRSGPHDRQRDVMAHPGAAPRQAVSRSRSRRTRGTIVEHGEFDTSTTTMRRQRPSNPSPVIVFTPESGDAASTSWPCVAKAWRRPSSR